MIIKILRVLIKIVVKKVFVLGEVDKDGNIITVNNEEMEEVF